MITDSPLTITHHASADGQRIALSGDLDYTNSPDLETLLRDLELRAGDTLTLDLGNLVFCDSTGLSTLISAYRTAAAAGATLAVSTINVKLARVMEITGVDHLFGITEETVRTEAS
ncbi:STAS domain-containing protein [Actinokineospora sp. G85]|uniref:STAS domain-containing protein n=1 Tax=Actinokineospora sp. G85 TaxID=3406626 RepID=UPI003C70B811